MFFYEWTTTQGHTSVGQKVKSYIHQFCADTVYHQKDLIRAMVDRDGWCVRVKRIYATTVCVGVYDLSLTCLLLFEFRIDR